MLQKELAKRLKAQFDLCRSKTALFFSVVGVKSEAFVQSLVRSS